MYYKEDDLKRIKEAASDRMVDIISNYVNLKKTVGGSYTGDCPMCGRKGKLSLNDQKNIFKCFSCSDLKGTSAIDFLMIGQKMTYMEALDAVAKFCNIYIAEPEKPLEKEVFFPKKRKSFCAKILEESGLTKEDVTASVFSGSAEDRKVSTFFSGTVDSMGHIDYYGDDMIIAYYDLYGKPYTYEYNLTKNKTETREYFRVRWQFPDDHLDKSGKPFKYKSPAGSGTFTYIPHRLRVMVQDKREIDTLYIQEGEKKAEKACKHGIPSIAISGIHNFGQNGRVPEDVVTIIEKCNVRKVCFILDSDWNEISRDIKVMDDVMKRPRLFYTAVKNFKDYMTSLVNRGIYVDIFFGYVLPNPAKDKGVDDLLSNTLKGKESELEAEISVQLLEKIPKGNLVQVHKISDYTDLKLQKFWSLDDISAFALINRDILSPLPFFMARGNKWKIEEGEVVSAQPLDVDEQYWKIEENDRGKKSCIFHYGGMYCFLENRGFSRYLEPSGEFSFIRSTPPFIKSVKTWEIKDYVMNFTKDIRNKEVMELLYRGSVQYLGPDKMSNLKIYNPAFSDPEEGRQLLFFKNSFWEIKREAIKQVSYSSASFNIWSDSVKNIEAKLLPPLINVRKDEGGKFHYEVSSVGKDCHFLQFLINASNFSWRKKKLIESGKAKDMKIDLEEEYDNTVHLIAKLCAIGYLATEYKDPACAKAVIAMDGKLSEVGSSNGRSGKSLVGMLLQNVTNTVYIDGKKPNLTADQFLWDDVVEKTRVVFCDDLKVNFDFESVFTVITGSWKVNYKGGVRVTFPFEKSPKIYMATNHAINGDGSSFSDRQWFIAFSDWYNGEHTPTHDFGIRFFSDWDFDQWNLCWNLVAQCIQLYYQFGCIQAPSERIGLRQMRQFITETFMIWADEYFSADNKRNERLARKELYDDFLINNPNDRKYTSNTNFKKKMKAYCQYKGYVFNPHRYDSITGQPMKYDADGNPDIDDKSGGIEYFVIGDNGTKTRESVFVEEEESEELPY